MCALDLTPAFHELLKRKSEGGVIKAVPQAGASATADGFLKEAYRINGHIATLANQLSSVRPAYLSTAPPRRGRFQSGNGGNGHQTTALTDSEREEIDANAKRVLRDLNASIRSLAEAEALHQETQQALVRKKFRVEMPAALARLAFFGPVSDGDSDEGRANASAKRGGNRAVAEEALRQAATHRESVLWFLRQRLQACGRAQQTMMEARLARMVETSSRSAPLSLQRAVNGKDAAFAADPALHSADSTGAADVAEAGLTAEQLQMFERGNQDMVKHYESTLDKVRSVEHSLVEISELQTMLVSNLEMQSAHVDQMVTDSENTADNVARGNEELKKALARPRTARYTFYAASGLCLFVVVWDFFV